MDARDSLDAPWLVLIGPAAAGKTTLGEAVAALTGRPFVDIDAVAGPYYEEVGWSLPRLRARIGQVGRVAAEREWEPARAHAVERVVADHPGAVVALGAGHTCYAEPGHAARVRAALERCSGVLFVLPDPDAARSLRILRDRSARTKGTDWVVDGHDFLSEWLHDPFSRSLATEIVHTAGETPWQTAERVALAGWSPPAW
jgi:shikimate kinase